MNGDTRYSYGEYVKIMYQKGYYVSPYYINIMSDEIYYVDNKILIIPVNTEEEDNVYVFTGASQKITTLSEPTEFVLYLEDAEGSEFRDGDNIMLSLIRPNDVINLYTRNYAAWKFGLTFDKGIHLDPDKYLMFQAQKDIGKFDIDIHNVDLFRHKKIKRNCDRMMWLD